MTRKYALTKLAAGDYLCPSNDRTLIWRFQRYQDGAALGLDVSYDLRPFWRAMTAPVPDSGFLDFASVEQWPWEEHATWLPTRAAAIESMLANHERIAENER